MIFNFSCEANYMPGVSLWRRSMGWSSTSQRHQEDSHVRRRWARTCHHWMGARAKNVLRWLQAIVFFKYTGISSVKQRGASDVVFSIHESLTQCFSTHGDFRTSKCKWLHCLGITSVKQRGASDVVFSMHESLTQCFSTHNGFRRSKCKWWHNDFRRSKCKWLHCLRQTFCMFT